MLTLNKVTWSLDDKAIASLLKVNDARRWNKLGADEMQISVTAASSLTAYGFSSPAVIYPL